MNVKLPFPHLQSLAAMRNLSLLTPIFFLFCLLCYISSVSTSTPRYTAVDNIILSCGTRGNSTAMDKREWIGDIQSKFTPIEEPNHKSNASTTLAQRQDLLDTVPYMTARLSYTQFTYEFHLSTPGPKFLRLYFHPASYPGFEGSHDFFTVTAGSFTLLRNFSASIHANYLKEETLSKEFCINVEKDQILNIAFIPSPSTSSKFYAFINGIEIVSMPNNLYYVQGGPLGPYYVGETTSQFFINYEMALEKVFRINVGGGFISPVEDSGLFRAWSQQESNYWLGSGVIPHEVSFTPMYTEISNYTAPDDIYRSAVSMGPNTTKNLGSNLTLQLPVVPGFYYLVRLHFCEMEFPVMHPNERVFDIYIDNQMAEKGADVILWTKRNETPVYKDYVVDIQNKSNLTIALLPTFSAVSVADVILNAVEVFKLSDNEKNLAGPNPESVPTPPPAQQPAPTASESKTKKTKIIAIGNGAGFTVVLTIVICCMLLRGLRKSKRYASYYPPSKCWCWPEPNKGKSTMIRTLSLPGELCRHFSLDEIKTATHNFHKELIIGDGGFGNVYKGFIDDATMTVAIKRLNPESKQGFHEFWTEIGMLSQLRHVHLVSLIGFCYKEDEMILVYDYMTNGTLCHHLYETPNEPLSWKRRLKICIGAASGLNYLHTGMKQPIIHRDVKTNNILLDEKWVAKVSDFGLSKTGKENTAISTLVKGTLGYLDPDYARRQQLTERSDVYSFGVVLFEVLCARKALDKKVKTEQWHLANWARKCIERENFGEIIDPYLKGKIAPECFKVYVEVAESCVRDQAIQRPKMKNVMEKLRFALELQENADTAKKKINLDGEHSYPEVVSFRVIGTVGVPRNSNIYNEHVLETDSGTGLATTGLTYPILDFDAITT